MDDSMKPLVCVGTHREHVSTLSNRIERVLQNCASLLNDVFELAYDARSQIARLLTKARELRARRIENGPVVAYREAQLVFEPVEGRIDRASPVEIGDELLALSQKAAER